MKNDWRCVHFNYMTAINEQEIPCLLPDFSTDNLLSNHELMEIYHHSIPNSWSKEKHCQGFDPVEGSSTDFLEFCKCTMRATEDFQPDQKKPDNNNKGGCSMKHINMAATSLLFQRRTYSRCKSRVLGRFKVWVLGIRGGTTANGC